MLVPPWTGAAGGATKKQRRKNPQEPGLKIRKQRCQLIQSLLGCLRVCAAKSFGFSTGVSVPLVLLGMRGVSGRRRCQDSGLLEYLGTERPSPVLPPHKSIRRGCGWPRAGRGSGPIWWLLRCCTLTTNTVGVSPPEHRGTGGPGPTAGSVSCSSQHQKNPLGLPHPENSAGVLHMESEQIPRRAVPG